MSISDREINYYLDLYKIKHSNKGYRYLIEMIKIYASSAGELQKLCNIYDAVAKIYNVKPKSVERAVRYAVINNSDTTSKEFIAQAADVLSARTVKSSKRV